MTVLTLCGLFIMADLLAFRQTLEMRTDLSWTFIASVMFGQIVSAFLLVWLVLVVVRKNYLRQKRPTNRRGYFAIVQPLRRLIVSVWS
jgi:hypothetical protein